MKNDPLIGRRLANFQVERPLGRGGMAQVYYGTDVKLNRPVAIKVIDARYRDEPDYAKRFVREAQTIAVWRHENIIQIYYADDEDGFYYYVMEYIDGGDLSDLMGRYRDQGQPIPQTEILRMGKAIASALDYAHQQGVIHRDIKPANVMVASDGRLVVSDFGLAMDVDIGSTGEVFGSARYVAPEQARNSSQAVPQSDIYALGVMLYEMLTGQVPFDDPSSSAVALQHLTMPPPPPRTVNPNLNSATESVLLTALNKSPEHRYQTGQLLMQALEAALEDNSTPTIATVPDQTSPEAFAATIPSKPPAPTTPAPPPVQTGPPTSPPPTPTAQPASSVGGLNPMVAAGGGAVVAVIILGLLFMAFFGGDDEPAEAPASTIAEQPETTEADTSTESSETQPPSADSSTAADDSTTPPTEGEETAPEIEPTATPVPTDTPEPEPATPTSEPEPQVVADSNADFSEVLTNWEYFWGPPGSNEWTAMQEYKAEHYGRPCWHTYPNHVRICNDFGNPGNSDDIAWRWRSTVSGTLAVQIQARKLSNSGDGVVISVYQGGTDSFPLMEQSTKSGLINETLMVDNVSEGEFIFFVMNKNGNETLDDTEFYAKICQHGCP